MKRYETQPFAVRANAGTGSARLFALALAVTTAGCSSWLPFDNSNPDEYMSHWCDPLNLSRSPAYEGDGVVPHDLSSLPGKEECMNDYYQRRDNEAKR